MMLKLVLITLGAIGAADSFAFAPRMSLDWVPNTKALKGKICVVTGASRGIGKGIALGLGEQGATVYVTGRTKSELAKTADEITAKGGVGVAVVVDHTDKEQIKGLFKKVEEENEKIDVLVNNVFSAVSNIFDPNSLDKKYWERNLDWWDEVNSAGLRGHYIASQAATPLMLETAKESDPGLIVIVSSWGGVAPLFDAAYGIGKSAKDRMARELANDLSGKPINVISLYPGAVRTEVIGEMVLDNTEAKTSTKAMFKDSESTLFQGRAVAALARDPEGTKKRNGKIVISADLGEELGFTEEDGTRPMSFRTIKFLFKDTIIAPLIPRFLKIPRKVIALATSGF